MTVSVEYTPRELVAGLQLFDYFELRLLEEGIPMGVIGLHRQKLMEALLKEDVYSELELEREEMMDEIEEMFTSSESPLRNGFQ